MSTEHDNTGKSDIRKAVLAIRRSLAKDLVHEYSQLIADRITRLPIYLCSDDICIYMPVRNEVDLTLLIPDMRSRNKRIWLPRVSGGCMDFYLYAEDTALIDGAFNIPEPDTDISLPSEASPLVIMPGAVFSEDRCRIGYGGGYYDRYLSTNRLCTAIAVCYDFQVMKHIPSEEHDVKPSLIVTDKRLL